MEGKTAVNNEWVQFGINQLELFEKDQQAYIETLVKSSAIQEAMITVYRICVARNLMEPIEKAEAAEKVKWWERAKAIAEGRLSKEKLADFSKILYMLG